MTILRKLTSLFKGKNTAEEQPLRAVVLLLRGPATVTEGRLRTAIFRAWNWHIGTTDAELATQGLLVCAAPTSVIKLDNHLFIVNNFERRYGDDPDRFAAQIPDLRQRQVVKDSRAWLSVDVIRPEQPSPAEKIEVYRKICRLAAELLDNNCLGVYLPETGVLRAHDEALLAAMRSEHPLHAVGKYPYVPVVHATEEQLHLAVEEARRRWPEFVGAFRTRKPDQPFSVKAPFREADYCEWMWINVQSVEGDLIAGELGNAPLHLTGLHEGDDVTARAEEVGDWMYLQEDGQPVGGFTVDKLLKDNM